MIILKQFNIENLSPEIQEQIEEEINELTLITKEDINELIEELDIDIDSRALYRYIRNAQENRITRQEFYDPRSTLMSRFDIPNYPTRNDTDARSKHIHSLKRSDIRPVAAILKPETLEQTITFLEESKENTPAISTGEQDKPFNEMDINNIDMLLNILNELDITATRSSSKVNIQNISKLFGDISDIELIEGPTREQFYEYWKGVDKKYKQLIDAFSSMEQAWLSTFTMDRLSGGTLTLGQGGSSEVPQEIREQIEEINETLKANKVIIPNYIINMPIIKSPANTEEDKVKYLITSYLEFSGESNIPTKLKPYSKRTTSNIHLEESTKEEGEEKELPQELASIPDSQTYESEEALSQSLAESRLSELESFDEVDPYFAILLAKHSKLIRIDENIIEKAVTEIVNLYDYGDREEIQKLHLKHINRFMKLYKVADQIANQPPFYMHLIDDPSNVRAIEIALHTANKKEIGVQYVDIGDNASNIQIKGLKYKSAVDFLNKETIKFMDTMYQMLEISSKTTRLPLARPKGGQRQAPGTVAFTSPTFIEKPSQIGEVNVKLIKAIPNVLVALQDYYFAPLGSNQVALDDLPEFALSSSYNKVRVQLDKSYNNLLIKSLLKDEVVTLHARDVNKITRFFKELRKGTELDYSELFAEKASSALEGLLKLYGGLSKETNFDGDSILREIIDKYEILFGAILYDYAEADLNPENLENETWEGHKLSYYKQRYEQSDFDIENLYSLLVNPVYESLIAKAESENNHIIKAVKVLKNELNRSEVKDIVREIQKSMLNVYDTLRELNEMEIHKGYLEIDDFEDVDYVIKKIKDKDDLSILVKEIEEVLTKQESYDKIAKSMGLSEEIIYKIKGLFR